MHHHYADIRERIKEPVCWWDENAVPRYRPFSPHETANIYAYEAVLLHIECQGCGAGFNVCMSHCQMGDAFEGPTLSSLIKTGAIHYGDPPNIECCPAGPTMNSVPRRVLEYWKLDDKHEWRRDPALEVEIKCDWADDDA